MDLSKLLTQQQTESRGTASAPQQYGQASSDQLPQSAAPHGSQHAERQASYGRPHLGHLDNISPGPPLNTAYIQQSPSTYYPPPQPSPYSASRPSSNGHMPATPTQLQPPHNPMTYPQAISPTPSSHRSHTPLSIQQSPMPTLQRGVPLGPPTSLHADPQPYESYSSPQQYRLPPALGLPSQRMSVEHLTSSPDARSALSPATRRVSERSIREREASADISPRSLPLTRPGALGSRHSSMQDESGAYHNAHPPAWESQHNITSQQIHSRKTSQRSTFPSASPVVEQRANTTQSPADPHSLRRSTTMDVSNMLSNEPPPVKNEPEDTERARQHMTNNTTDNKKRAPEDELASSRPVKKERTRRHLERPIWARLSRNNPRSSGAPLQRTTNGAESMAQSGPQLSRAANGVPVAANAPINYEQPWLNPLPYDMDLIHARKVLGAWEKSIKWNTPYPGMLRAVQDWLVHNLQLYQDAAQDPHLGTIEIEAKIGRLVRPSNGQRAGLPVLHTTLLDPSVNRDYRFESELEETDFEVLNKFLNQTLVDSMQPGRQKMEYKHITETDSFAHLGPVGHALLPKSLHGKTPSGRELKLRTTTQVKTGKVTARIVKVGLADLHIYNPTGYDCRISMNAEVNMMRPGQQYEELIVPATEQKPVPASRTKDRLSYKHLAYQIDLTKVGVAGLPNKYEMEIEVDAQALSSQIKLMTEGQSHAFTDVVSGFLDNATFLMRQHQPSN